MNGRRSLQPRSAGGPDDDLPFKIHPIFSRDNFHADFNYQLMRVPCAIASGILEFPQSIHWYTSCWYGRQEKTSIKSKDGFLAERIRNPRRRVTDLSEKDIEEVKSRLTEFGHNMVKFELNDLPDADGSSSRDFPYKSTGFFTGRSSRISLARRWYSELEKPEDGTSWPAANVKSIQFAIANILLHELAHCANYAITSNAFPKSIGEDFVDEEKIGEMGFSYEAHLYGVVIESGFSPIPKKYAPKPQWRQWCTTSWAEDEEYAQSLAMEGSLPSPEWFAHSELSREYILQFFSRQFYARLDPLELIPSLITNLYRARKRDNEGAKARGHPTKAEFLIPVAVRDIIDPPPDSGRSPQRQQPLRKRIRWDD